MEETVAYLFGKLDPVARGWPKCLRAIAAAALLVKDTDKLTLGKRLTVIAPHTLESIVRQPPDCWLTNARITHYQSILLDKDQITFGPPTALNPATLLPDSTAITRLNRRPHPTPLSGGASRREWNSTGSDQPTAV